ncbi:NDR1/HIN1-like protein 6 [Magnolia sinica]|uniref:NDR1/HIN1-like protein 6 n=1 Tax=Magnolia sinica TaxID=86752 RepID=UPI00265AAD26|nr:NDR1/HIN1-like protein 6 [Magnolia sinica]
MADLAHINQAPPLPKPPGHDDRPEKPKATAARGTHRRRVSFSNHPTMLEKPRERRGRSCCCICCALTWILILSLLLVAAVGVGLLYLWFEPTAPGFRIERLSVPQLDLMEDSDQMHLTAEVNLSIVVSNKNDEMRFSYDNIVVFVSSEGVIMGRTTVPKFALGPKNVSIVKVYTRLSNSLVDNAEAERLRAGFERKDLVLEVTVDCMMSVMVGNWRSIGVPTTILCENLQWARIGHRFEPRCRVIVLGL